METKIPGKAWLDSRMMKFNGALALATPLVYAIQEFTEGLPEGMVPSWAVPLFIFLTYVTNLRLRKTTTEPIR